MFSKTAVAPLDRIKILLQAHNAHYKNFGVLSGLRGIVLKEGFVGLYKGNAAMMVRIFPYAAVQFVSFETYKPLFRDSFLGEVLLLLPRCYVAAKQISLIGKRRSCPTPHFSGTLVHGVIP